MSTLVMVEKDGVGCIAADTLTTWGSTKQSARYLSNHEKIVHVDGAYIGVVGYRVHQTVIESAIANGLELPELRSELDLFEFSRKLMKKLRKEYGWGRGTGADPFEASRMTFFVLNRWGLFALYPMQSVERCCRFSAVGSGCDYALGAMYAAYEQDLPAEDVARLGVEAGVEFDDGSGAPITLKKVKLEA